MWRHTMPVSVAQAAHNNRDLSFVHDLRRANVH